MSGAAGRIARFDARAQRFSSEKMEKVKLFSGASFFLDLYCLEPGQAQKPHAHADSSKIYLVVEGRARVALGDEELDLAPGEAVMAEPGENHGLRNETRERLVVLTFMSQSLGG